MLASMKHNSVKTLQVNTGNIQLGEVVFHWFRPVRNIVNGTYATVKEISFYF
jgi:hypothetical protein